MSHDYSDYILDLLSSWAKVNARKMFGGYGIYRQGKMFAIIVDDTLYFKVSDTNRPDYEAAGTSPFTYTSKGKQITMSYWQVPDEVLEDSEKLSIWAEKAYQEALVGRRRGGLKK